jgi:hypothetical protein
MLLLTIDEFSRGVEEERRKKEKKRDLGSALKP